MTSSGPLSNPAFRSGVAKPERKGISLGRILVLLMAVGTGLLIVGIFVGMSESGEAGLLGFTTIFLLVSALCFYGLPSAIGFHRQHPQRWVIFVVNLFLGWSLIGWVVALAIAVSAVRKEA